MRKINFSAGPAALPVSVLEKVRESVLEIEDRGTGIFEVGHRTSYFKKALDETKTLLSNLLKVPTNYEILFIQGGASLQFSMIPLNLQRVDRTNSYLISGSWSKKALEEAQSLAHGEEAGSSEEHAFKSLPEISKDITDASYLHFTSNNTIYGTQFKNEPEVNDIPLVCDASSDILSRPIEVSKYSVIYAGAQKNLGPAGVTIVIIKKDCIPDSLKNVPRLLQYKTYQDSDSSYNTPPVSSILVVKEVLHWINEQGGLHSIRERNQTKAEMVYNFLDKSSLYQPYADPSARSQMNVTFTLEKPSLEPGLLTYLEKENITGLKGHRSIGGLRISLYNSITLEEVTYLLDALREFESKS